jgi:hypothetical protein
MTAVREARAGLGNERQRVLRLARHGAGLKASRGDSTLTHGWN